MQAQRLLAWPTRHCVGTALLKEMIFVMALLLLQGPRRPHSGSGGAAGPPQQRLVLSQGQAGQGTLAALGTGSTGF